MFGLHKTDLYLPDVLPIALTRTYNSADSAARPFGRGMSHVYAMFLWSAQQWQEADLILPEGGRLHYVRTSAGTSWVDAVFVHQETPTTSATPTIWYKSVISWNGNGWNLQRKDGMVFVFGENAPLQAIRDRNGNQLTVNWSNGQGGRITRLRTPSGRWVAFTYDGAGRITQARDNAGRTVGYQYDASGRLWKVTDAAGAVTEYAYDAGHRLATVKDGRGVLILTNAYDGNGRISQQTLADGSTYQFAYVLNGAGKVELESVNGGVSLALPAESKASVVARVTNGGIRTGTLEFQTSGEQSRRRFEGTLNGGGTAVTVETTNGGVRLSKSTS